MQLQSMTTHLAANLGFAAIADGLAVVEEAGYTRLLYASRSDSRLSALTLAEAVPPPAPQPGDPLIGQAPGSDITLHDTGSQTRAFVFSSYSGTMRQALIGSTGLPGSTNGANSSLGSLSGVTAMEIFDTGTPTDLAVIAQRGVEGLRVFGLSEAGFLTLLSLIEDGPKSYLGDVADLAGLRIDGRNYLLVASALENGITCLEVLDDGQTRLVDALGARDGLPIAGPVAMQTALVGGVHYVVLASTLSSSLTVLRVNAMGVLFQADHLVDDRNTRFDDVAALDMFSHRGRAFVVAAGTDAGFSVLELLPDGRLSPILSLPMESGGGLAAVTGIETAVTGTTLHVVMTDARGDRIHQVTLSLASLGNLIVGQGGSVTGTALDDRLLGSALADSLLGGAGADVLHDGAGADTLTGGAGADVFVLARDGAQDRIADFQQGFDRIDVSDWGRIYSASALAISQTATGAQLAYAGEVLLLTSATGGPLTLTEADFLF